MGGYRPFSTLVDGRPEGEVFSEEFGQYINPVAEEMRFFGELKDIRKITDSFNLVMFPVDGRIGNGYTLGGRQFIEPTNVARAESQARLGYALQVGGRRSQPTNEEQR